MHKTFTAIDFETAHGRRWSICQVGLVRVENGIIKEQLLSDCLNIQIVCSFNTDISKIDSALMRKGRLIAKYEFKELEIHKARQLSGKLGFNTNINQPMTLTSIYN